MARADGSAVRIGSVIVTPQLPQAVVGGTQYTSRAFTRACARLRIRQYMGRVGCALDDAAAESFFSTLQHERLSRHCYATRAQARRDIAAWID